MYTFNIEKSLSIKRKISKINELCELYKKYSHEHIIGSCIYLVNKLKPKDCYDFEKKYHEYANKNKKLSISNRGLTREELNNLVSKMKKEGDEVYPKIKFSEEDYYHLMMVHIIVETFAGFGSETIIYDYVKEKLKRRIEKPKTNNMDGKYGIDFILYNNFNKWDAFIQVKPISFFLGKKGHIVDDQNHLLEKREMAKKKYDVDTLYCIYVLNHQNGNIEWLINKNDKVLFKKNDLFKTDNSIKNRDFFIKKQRKILDI